MLFSSHYLAYFETVRFDTIFFALILEHENSGSGLDSTKIVVVSCDVSCCTDTNFKIKLITVMKR